MNKKIKTILTVLLTCIMSTCLMLGLAGCNFSFACNHNYVDGVCGSCGEKDPSWAYTLSITNKEDLTAEWIEESETRELAILITKGGVETTDKEYQVETSDSGVISVGDDNKTLTAVGGGTATITVTLTDDYGEILQDSVEITVIPYLRGVEITNKSELQAVWVLGDAARTLALLFNPEYYNENVPAYTVTSSDPAVIEVGEDKATLTAKSIGTATITVTAGDFSDSVEMSVRPALEGLTIANKAELSAVWNDWTVTRDIEVVLSPSDYYNVDNTAVEVTFSEEGLVKADGLTLKAKAVGTVTVTVTAGAFSDNFTVTMERSAPVITFIEMSGFDMETGEVNGIENEEITLPRANAITCDGSDVTLNVEMEVAGDEATIKNGALIGPKGTYSVQYTVKDSENENLVATRTVIVNVYRNVFAWTDSAWQWIDQYAEDAEQSVTLNKYGYQTAAFNVEAGEYYYAEAEIELTGRGAIGMAHYIVEENGSYNKERWLATTVANWGQYDFKFIDFDTSVFGANNDGSWTTQEGKEWLNVINSWRLTEFRGLKANENPNVHKLGIVRMGDWFISFWNDQYVMMATNEFFAGETTIPGLFHSADGSDLKISKMNWITGEEAVAAKLAELTHNGKDVNMPYVPDSFAIKSLNPDNFTSNEVSEERGLNFDFNNANCEFNDGMVSNYVWFDGDFTYEWDYLNTAGNYRMLAEMRNRIWYGTDGVEFGAQYDGNGKYNRSLLNCSKFVEGTKWYEKGHDFDASQGIHFVITRKLHADYAEITMLTQSIANPSQYVSRTITQSADPTKSTDGQTAFPNWNKPVTIQWHNTRVSGQYSNIKWDNKAYAHDDHILSATSYVWSEDNSQCTATRACIFNGCDYGEMEIMGAVANVTTAKDCTTAEQTTYTVTFTNPAFAQQSKTVQTADALGHNLVDVEAKEPTEKDPGYNAHKACDREGCDYTEGYQEIPKLGSAPIVTFGEADGFTASENGGTMVGYENRGIMLPTVMAISCDNIDVSDSVSITVEGATIEDGILTASKGTYEVKYIVADPYKPELVTTKVITITLAREILGYTDGTFNYVEDNQYVADNEQILINEKGGFQMAAFNMEASNFYYAEVEFTASKAAAGIANFNVDENGKVITSTFLTSTVAGNDRNYKFLEFHTQGEGAWTTQEGKAVPNVIYMYRLKEYRCLVDNEKCTDSNVVSKVAVARIGNFYYNFWNDQYVMAGENDKFNGMTIPGIFLENIGSVTMTNINYFSGEEAVRAKVAEITNNGQDMNVNYVPDSWAKDSQNINNRNFTSNAATDSRGLNFDFTKIDCHENAGMVSNYVWFDGDFTYEWDHKGIAGNSPNANSNRMTLEVRYKNYGDSKLRLGAEYQQNGTFTKALLHTPGFAEGYKWNEPKNLDASQGLHFVLTRKLHADYAEYRMIVYSIANPAQAYSRTFTMSADPTKSTDGQTAFADWNKPATVLWKSWGLTGEFSNIKWSNSATEHDAHIYGGASYAWSEDNAQCTASRSCMFYGCSHVDTETVDAVANVTTAKDCTTAEKTTYTATFTNAVFAQQSKTAQTADALGHDLITIPGKAPTETDGGYNDYQKCQREGCNYTEGYQEIPKLGAPPVMTFGEANNFTATEVGGNLVGSENKGITLPDVTAISCDNADISEMVSITANGGEIVDGLFTAPKGTYEITYYVADPNNANLTTTKIITVTVAREVLVYNDSTWSYAEGKQYVADSEQALVNTKNGFQMAAFNMPASNYYYAEVEFNSTVVAGGIANFNVDENGKVITSSFLTSWVRGADRNYKFVDFKTSGDGAWSTQENKDNIDVIYAYQLIKYLGLKDNEKSTEGNFVSKMAVARIGDFYVNFWNDQYVMMAAKDNYKGITIPGLFLDAGGNMTVTNINYFSGKEAVEAKVAEITHNGKDVNMNYVSFLDWGGSDSQNIDNRNFTSNENTNGRGVNFDFTKANGGFNGTMVSNYVWFDSDFTYEWDYLNTDGDYRMLAELRYAKSYADGGIQFGAQYAGGGAFSKVLLNVPGFAEGSKWWESGSDFDASQGIHFKITRKLYSDYAEITMTTTSIANPSQVKTRTIKMSADASKSSDGKTSFANWNRPVTLQWHNERAAGQYSNITWKASV